MYNQAEIMHIYSDLPLLTNSWIAPLRGESAAENIFRSIMRFGAVLLKNMPLFQWNIGKQNKTKHLLSVFI